MKQNQSNIIRVFGLFVIVILTPSIIQATERIQSLNNTVTTLQNQYRMALNDYNTFLLRNDIHTTYTNSKCKNISLPEGQKQQLLSGLMQLKQNKERKLYQLERGLSLVRKELHNKQTYRKMTGKQKKNLVVE